MHLTNSTYVLIRLKKMCGGIVFNDLVKKRMIIFIWDLMSQQINYLIRDMKQLVSITGSLRD